MEYSLWLNQKLQIPSYDMEYYPESMIKRHCEL